MGHGGQEQSGVFPGIPTTSCCPHLGHPRGQSGFTEQAGLGPGARSTYPGHSWKLSRSNSRSCWRSVLCSKRGPLSRPARLGTAAQSGPIGSCRVWAPGCSRGTVSGTGGQTQAAVASLGDRAGKRARRELRQASSRREARRPRGSVLAAHGDCSGAEHTVLLNGTH